MPFRDELEEAWMQLVWLKEMDLLNGIRSSNFSLSNLTSWQITDISPLEERMNGKMLPLLRCYSVPLANIKSELIYLEHEDSLEYIDI